MARDSSVSIGTRYWLDGPGIESRWGARFSAPVQTDPEAHPASYTMGTESFLGVKRLGLGLDHPPQPSAEVKERVDLYLYSPLGLRGLFWGELHCYLTERDINILNIVSPRVPFGPPGPFRTAGPPSGPPGPFRTTGPLPDHRARSGPPGPLQDHQAPSGPPGPLQDHQAPFRTTGPFPYRRAPFRTTGLPSGPPGPLPDHRAPFRTTGPQSFFTVFPSRRHRI